MGVGCSCEGYNQAQQKQQVQDYRPEKPDQAIDKELEKIKLRFTLNKQQIQINEENVVSRDIYDIIKKDSEKKYQPLHPNQDPDSIKIQNINRKESIIEQQLPKEPQKFSSTHLITKKSLFERLGQEEGLKNFSDLMVQKIVGDNQLSVFFTETQLELYREKFKYYLQYILGHRKFWIGRSLKEVHQSLDISEEAFYCFIGHCEKSLFELNLDRETVYETINKLSEIRDDIIKQPEDNFKSLIYHLGDFQNLTLIAQLTMQKVISCPVIGSYFAAHDIGLHEKRLTYYLFYIAGGTEEWLGKTLRQAHRGKGIQQHQFDIMVSYIHQSVLETKVKEQYAQKLLDLLNEIKHDIIEQEEHLTLYEKLDKDNKFQLVMTSYIDKMANDNILGYHFKNNPKMKHHIPNKILMFFAYSQGQMNTDDKQSLKEMHKCLKLSIFDFERSIRFFTEALYESQIDPMTVKEAVTFYKTLKRELVYDEHEEQITAQQELFHKGQQSKDKTMHLVDDPFFKEKPEIPQPQQQQQQPQSSCPFHQMMQTQKAAVHQATQQANVNVFEEVKKKESHQKEITANQAPIHKNIIIETPKMNEQSENLKKANHNLSPQRKINETKTEQTIHKSQHKCDNQQSTPIKTRLQSEEKNKNEQLMRREYRDDELWDEPVIYQGELYKIIEKNQTLIPRWIVLKSQCLLIYKDNITMLSQTNKPLQIIQLENIQQIKDSEKILKKKDQIYLLEIDLKNGVILNSSVMSSRKVGHSGRKDHNVQHEQQVVFASEKKQDITQWLKQLTYQITLIRTFNKDINHLI